MTLKDLATTEEAREVAVVLEDRFKMPNHNPNCTHKHLLLRYAFEQKWTGFPAIRFWHVMSEGQSKHSTLSMEGLKEWGLI